MDFDSDYWNSLDKAKELRIDPKQIGISHGLGELGEGLRVNIFRGASIVELGFMGQGKGFRSQPTGHTPETYGRAEREEIRQLAKINEVELSTHASPNIGSLGGYHEGTFSDAARQNAVFEVERAIDFAADTAEGGPVVVHLGEFPRPLYEVDKKFKAYSEEEQKSPIYAVDTRTGQVKPLSRMARYAVPDLDKPERDEKGNFNWKVMSIYELEQEHIKQAKKEGKQPDVVQYIQDNIMKKDVEFAEGEERRLRHMANEVKESYNKFQEILERAEKDDDPVQKNYFLVKQAEKFGIAPQPGSKDYQDFLQHPEKAYMEGAKQLKEQYEAYNETERSYSKRRAETLNEIEHTQSIVKYGVDQSAKAISQIAMNAYEKERKYKLEKPLWIALENWTPELYGSHPRELREVITKSREDMAEELRTKQNMSATEAKKIASEHIKATFDIGHLNMWKKYFAGKEDDFKEWVDEEVTKLVKDGIIGHVHLTDNFGYYDEHLLPGEGNAPIQKFLSRLKENKFKGTIIAEPGGQKEGQHYRVWTDALKIAGSPIYRVDSLTRSWGDIEGGYFGRVPQSPYFIVGDYAPSKDWTLWSETPLE